MGGRKPTFRGRFIHCMSLHCPDQIGKGRTNYSESKLDEGGNGSTMQLDRQLMRQPGKIAVQK